MRDRMDVGGSARIQVSTATFEAAWHVKKNERTPVTAAQALVVLADLMPELASAKKLYDQALKILKETRAQYAIDDAVRARETRLSQALRSD